MSGKARPYNNPESKARRSTSFTLSFPTMPSLNRQPRKIELHQSQYSHDVMVVTFATTGQLWFDTIPTGLPVQFYWKQGILEKTWFGYVSFISKTVAVQREKIMEVHIVGSSFPLKERATRVFNDRSIPEAAEIIAKEHGFTFVGDTHARRFPQLVMAGHSYWEWLHEQAARIGFALVVDGTTMYFREIDRIIDQKITSIAVLSMGDSQSLYRGQYYDRTLDMFRVMKGDNFENTENLRAQKYSGGVNPVTMLPFVESGTPDTAGDNLRSSVNDVLFSDYRTDQVANERTDAASSSKGAAQMARLNMPAKVKCQGDARIHPYAPVYVRGTGSLTDGYWVVKDVVHIFQKFGDYNIEMTVVTDGVGQNQATSFREKQMHEMSTVNLVERVMHPKSAAAAAIPTKLYESSPAILPKEQGFKKSPAVWRAAGNVK